MQKYFSFLFLLPLLLCFNNLLQGQASLPLTFKSVDSKNGLLAPWNGYMKTDSKGYTWISSNNGVYVYNGVETARLKIDSVINVQGNSFAIKNIQSSFFEDKKGNVWFCTLNGLVYYDREEKIANTYQIIGEYTNTPYSAGYRFFHLESDSILWLKANDDIYRFEPKSLKTDSITSSRGFYFTVDTTIQGRVKTIFACPWSASPGLERIDISPGLVSRKTTFFEQSLPDDPNKEIRVSQIMLANDSLIWLISNQGLLALNSLTGVLENKYQANLINPNDILKHAVLYQGRYFLIGSKFSGLWIFDLVARRFVDNFRYNENQENGIPSNDIQSIALSKRQQLWLASYNEAKLSNFWLDQPKSFFDLFEEKISVQSVVTDGAGHIWCATTQDGLYRFTPDLRKQAKFEYNHTSLEPIKRLSLDQTGELWGLAEGGVFHFHDDEWNMIYPAKQKPFTDLAHLSATVKLLSVDGDLMLLEQGSKGEWESRILNLEKEDLLVFEIHQSKDKNIFYCSNNGLEVLKLSWKADSLRLDQIFDVRGDVYSFSNSRYKDQLLLSTSNGPLILDTKADTILKVSSFEDISEVPAFYFVEGSDSDYWIANSLGLWRILEPNDLPQQYHIEDGIPSLALNLSAVHFNREKIYLGTVNGVTVIDLNKIKLYPYLPRLEIQNFSVNKETWKLPNVDVPELEFKHKENSISFRALALSEYNGELCNVRYRLLSNKNDSIWKYVGNPGDITLDRLLPGSYQLEIQPINSNGLLGDVKVLCLKIDQPIWKKVWFIVLVSMSAFLLITGVFRWYLWRQRKEFERQQEIDRVLQKERSRIGADMHEDIGGELTAIQLISKKVAKSKLNAADKKRMEEITQHAGESIAHMRDIIWAMKSEDDNLKDLCIFLRRHVVDYLDKFGIVCFTELSQLPEDLPVGSEKRSHILRCVKEASHNIVKHANTKEACFFANWDSATKLLEIIIEDRGKGIPESILTDKHYGNGLRNMQYRMKEIGGEVYYNRKIDGLQVVFQVPIARI